MITTVAERIHKNVPDDLVEKAYRLAGEISPYSSTRLTIPTFELIYDEYIAISLDEKLNMNNEQIERELEAIKKINKFDLDVVQTTESGIVSALELMDYLLDNRYIFSFQGTVHNSPITEVW